MKPLHTLLAIAALCGSPLLATAQQPAATPAATPAAADSPKHGPGEWKKQREWIEGLPEDVRSRFKEARDEAMKDPKIQALREKAEAAGKELRDAVRDAIAAKDPELATQLSEVLKKKEKDPATKEKKSRPDAQGESALQKLPPVERDRLAAAREIAKQAPAVQSAEAAMKAAQTPEARREAAKNFQKAMRDAMITADPSLADILDKIKPPKPDATPTSSTEMAQ
jgi:DNA-binding ferritin-like protein